MSVPLSEANAALTHMWIDRKYQNVSRLYDLYTKHGANETKLF